MPVRISNVPSTMKHVFFDGLPAFDAPPAQTTPRASDDDDLLAEIHSARDAFFGELLLSPRGCLFDSPRVCNSVADDSDPAHLCSCSTGWGDAAADSPTPDVLAQPAPSMMHPKLARGGGNKKDTKESCRQADVLTKGSIALWEPRKGYADQIRRLIDFIEDEVPTGKFAGGVEHPILGLYGFCITDDESRMIARRMYANRNIPDKAFGQLLTYLGMRSRTDKNTKVRTLCFDPEAWNRVGYRLIKNGDCRGGAPKINYLRGSPCP